MLDSYSQRRSEIETALGNSANDSWLRSQRHVLQDTLLGRNGRDALRHANTEINHAPKRQLKSTAPRNDLALVQFDRLNTIHRDALTT